MTDVLHIFIATFTANQRSDMPNIMYTVTLSNTYLLPISQLSIHTKASKAKIYIIFKKKQIFAVFLFQATVYHSLYSLITKELS